MVSAGLSYAAATSPPKSSTSNHKTDPEPTPRPSPSAVQPAHSSPDITSTAKKMATPPVPSQISHPEAPELASPDNAKAQDKDDQASAQVSSVDNTQTSVKQRRRHDRHSTTSPKTSPDSTAKKRHRRHGGSHHRRRGKRSPGRRDRSSRRRHHNRSRSMSPSSYSNSSNSRSPTPEDTSPRGRNHSSERRSRSHSRSVSRSRSTRVEPPQQQQQSSVPIDTQTILPSTPAAQHAATQQLQPQTLNFSTPTTSTTPSQPIGSLNLSTFSRSGPRHYTNLKDLRVDRYQDNLTDIEDWMEALSLKIRLLDPETDQRLIVLHIIATFDPSSTIWRISRNIPKYDTTAAETATWTSFSAYLIQEMPASKKSWRQYVSEFQQFHLLNSPGVKDLDDFQAKWLRLQKKVPGRSPRDYADTLLQALPTELESLLRLKNANLDTTDSIFSAIKIYMHGEYQGHSDLAFSKFRARFSSPSLHSGSQRTPAYHQQYHSQYPPRLYSPRLTPQQFTQQRLDHATRFGCYHCQENGHIARDCPKRHLPRVNTSPAVNPQASSTVPPRASDAPSFPRQQLRPHFPSQNSPMRAPTNNYVGPTYPISRPQTSSTTHLSSHARPPFQQPWRPAQQTTPQNTSSPTHRQPVYRGALAATIDDDQSNTISPQYPDAPYYAATASDFNDPSTQPTIQDNIAHSSYYVDQHSDQDTSIPADQLYAEPYQQYDDTVYTDQSGFHAFSAFTNISSTCPSLPSGDHSLDAIHGKVYTVPCNITQDSTPLSPTMSLNLTAVLDCGASSICISQKNADILRFRVKHKIELKTAAHPDSIPAYLAIPSSPTVLNILTLKYPVTTALIVDIGDNELLLGQTFFHSTKAILNFGDHSITFMTHAKPQPIDLRQHIFSNSTLSEAASLLASAKFTQVIVGPMESFRRPPGFTQSWTPASKHHAVLQEPQSTDYHSTSTKRLLLANIAQQHRALLSSTQASIATAPIQRAAPSITETPTTSDDDHDGTTPAFNPDIPKSWFDNDELEELDALVGADLNCFGNNDAEIHFSAEEFSDKAHIACLNAGDGSDRHYLMARALLEKHKGIFLKRLDPNKPMKVPPVRIITTHDQAVGCPRYLQHDKVSEDLKVQYVRRLANQGLIVPSTSAYNAPMIPVGPVKADGSRKIAHDFRSLNKITIPVDIAISSTEDIINRAASAPYSSIFDFLSAYLQLAVHPSDQHKLAFLSKLGKFEYRRAPMGPTNLPGDFSNRVEAFLSPLSSFVSRFYDDCLSAVSTHYFSDGGSLQKHLIPFDIDLQFLGPSFTLCDEADIDPFTLQLMADDKFLSQCALYNAVISIDKTKVARSSQVVVGHKCSLGKILIADKTMLAVQRIAPPKSVKSLLQYLGLANFCAKHIRNFADLTYPLTKLLCHGTPWNWSAEQQSAFEATKKAILNCTALSPPIPAGHPNHHAFLIFTDASNYAIAAIFCQFSSREETEECINILRFYSRKLSLSERNYSPTEKEGLAVMFAILKTHVYIYDAPKTVLYTDHSALTSLLKMTKPSPRVMRWILHIQQISGLRIHERAGKRMAHVDALTRLHMLDDPAPDNGATPSKHNTAALAAFSADSKHMQHSPTSSAIAIYDTQWHALQTVSISKLPLLDVPYSHRPSHTVLSLDATVLDWHDSPSSADTQCMSAFAAVTRSQQRKQTSRQQPSTLLSEEHTAIQQTVARPQVSTASPLAPEDIQHDSATSITNDRYPQTSRPSMATSQPKSDADQSVPQPPLPLAAPRIIAPSVWHSEIWLSTGSHESIRLNRIDSASIPRRFIKRIQKDMENYNIVFDNFDRPLSITGNRPNIRGITTVFNIPPPGQRIPIIVHAHIFGHFALFKTRARIEDMGYSWLGLDDDISQVVKRCAVCQLDNTHQSASHPAIAIPIPEGVFDVVHMDLLEMVPSDPDNFVYIFLLVDRLSKFPIAFPIKNKEASTIAECLWQIICTFGVPTTIVSDRGREFVNEIVDSLCNLHGIDRRVTSAYRPQANGQVERVNQSLLAVLRKCTADAPSRWVDWLDYTLLALRTATHSSTGFSPFHLMFGRPFRYFLDFSFLATWDTSFASSRVTETFVSFIQQLRQADLSSARSIATVNQAHQQASQDASRRGSIELQRLPIKSTVFLREVRPENKLCHRFIGPFFVHESSKKDLKANYILADDHGRVLQQSYPRDQLYHVVQSDVIQSLRQRQLFSTEEWMSAIKECSQVHAGPLPSSLLGDNSSSGSSDADHHRLWVIDKMLDHDVKNKLALVKWGGYAEPQWIPCADIHPDVFKILLRDWRHEMALQSGFGAPSRLGRRRRS